MQELEAIRVVPSYVESRYAGQSNVHYADLCRFPGKEGLSVFPLRRSPISDNYTLCRPATALVATSCG